MIGMDVSSYQGTIDWAAVKAQGLVEFAYTKATEGIALHDDQFERNYAVAIERGIPVGAYHFFRPAHSGLVQAEFFLQTLLKVGAKGHLAPMVDAELLDDVSPDEFISELAYFTKTVESAIGRRMVLYTGYAFWNDQIRSDAFSGHPLWVAAYNDDAAPPVPTGWSAAALWQHTDSLAVDGIDGPVDGDKMLVDLSTLVVR